MTFINNKTGSFTVSSKYTYSGDCFGTLIADSACARSAEQFEPAVQNFFKKLYQDPNFKKLFL